MPKPKVVDSGRPNRRRSAPAFVAIGSTPRAGRIRGVVRGNRGADQERRSRGKRGRGNGENPPALIDQIQQVNLNGLPPPRPDDIPAQGLQNAAGGRGPEVPVNDGGRDGHNEEVAANNGILPVRVPTPPPNDVLLEAEVPHVEPAGVNGLPLANNLVNLGGVPPFPVNNGIPAQDMRPPPTNNGIPAVEAQNALGNNGGQAGGPMQGNRVGGQNKLGPFGCMKKSINARIDKVINEKLAAMTANAAGSMTAATAGPVAATAAPVFSAATQPQMFALQPPPPPPPRVYPPVYQFQLGVAGLGPRRSRPRFSRGGRSPYQFRGVGNRGRGYYSNSGDDGYNGFTGNWYPQWYNDGYGGNYYDYSGYDGSSGSYGNYYGGYYE